MDVQVPRSTWQGLLLQSFCIPAIHGGQMCESGHPWRSDVRERPLGRLSCGESVVDLCQVCGCIRTLDLQKP